MKKIVSIVVIIVILLAVAWLIASQKDEVTQEQRVAPIESSDSFACADGKSIVAGYADGGSIVTLNLSDDRTVTLERSMSASGARYENESGFVFWTEGEGAFVEEGGERTFENCTAVEVSADSQDREVAGVVTNVDETQAMVDGPFVVSIETEDGEEVEIRIPSMGILLCEAKDNIANISEIEIGMTVEARGTVGSEGNSMVPCESSEHYLRIK